MRVNGDLDHGLPNTLSVCFAGVDASTLLAEVGDRVAASTPCGIVGSARPDPVHHDPGGGNRAGGDLLPLSWKYGKMGRCYEKSRPKRATAKQ